MKKNYTKTITDRTWFSQLLQHLARKWSGSILTTPEPTRGLPRYEGSDVLSGRPYWCCIEAILTGLHY